MITRLCGDVRSQVSGSYAQASWEEFNFKKSKKITPGIFAPWHAGRAMQVCCCLAWCAELVPSWSGNNLRGPNFGAGLAEIARHNDDSGNVQVVLVSHRWYGCYYCGVQ
jgi:hypothetical protein